MFAGIAVNALGHNHPKLVKAIQDQAEKLIHISSIYYNEPALIYAKKLVDLTSFDRIFYANSGAEANEGAIKLAVKYTGKSEVISTVESFHGRTVMTLAATGHEHYHEPFKAILPKGFINVPYNDIEAIKEAITENTAAIIVEPIQGEGGVNVPDMEYLKEIEKICHEKDIVFIVDEVQTGFGRSGTLFAHELFDVKPDIMTMAKGIGGGVPMGGILATEKVASAFVPGDHGTTFGGGPLVCAAANAVLDTIEEDNLLDNVNEVGEYFIEELKKLDKEVIADVRGKGLIIGLELTKPGAEYVDKLREKGFLINCTADKVLRFVPPLIITKEDIDEFVKALDETL
jgi:acetylornithine/N-succinyldiaminopimelate aminotransferase